MFVALQTLAASIAAGLNAAGIGSLYGIVYVGLLGYCTWMVRKSFRNTQALVDNITGAAVSVETPDGSKVKAAAAPKAD